MKKALLVISIIVLLFTAVSCKDETPKATAGTPRLSGITWGNYDAFAVMRETNSSRGISDGIGAGVNRLFGLLENDLEKISINDDKGLEWECDEIRTLGSNGLLTKLSCGDSTKNYFIDRSNDKALDLGFLMDGSANINNYRLQVTSSGLYATKDAQVVSVDVEKETMTPLTNPETDPIHSFYRDDAGNMLVYGSVNKLFPHDGSAPIEYGSDTFELFAFGIRDRDPLYMIANPSSDIIVSLRPNRIYHISSGAITWESLPYEKNCGDYCLYPLSKSEIAKKAISYDKHDGYVTIHDVSTGDLLFAKYNAPKNLDRKNVAYNDGHLLYSTASGLYSIDLEAQTTETLVEGSLARWQMTTGGVIYTKYITATDVETCFLNLATKETEKLSSSGVEVVSIASFVD